MRLNAITENQLPSRAPAWATGMLRPREFLTSLGEWIEDRFEIQYGLTAEEKESVYQAIKMYGTRDIYEMCTLMKMKMAQPRDIAAAIVNGEVDLSDLQDPAQEANRPPAQTIPAGTPPLDTLDPDTLYQLRDCDPSDLIDKYALDFIQPFIYDASNDKLYVGGNMEFHANMINKAYRPDMPESKLLRNIFSGGEFDDKGDYIDGSSLPGAIGRIAHGLSSINPQLQDATLVAIYAKKNNNIDIVKQVINQLLTRKYILPNAYVVYGNQLSTAADFMQNGQEASQEDIENGELQVAMHIGAWPNGKRLTSQEKDFIRKKLGLMPQSMKTHPMTKAMRDKNLLVPGQRWWAMTSESKRFKLKNLR